jgi:ABC-type sugar transport system ATPase subunit
MKLTEQPLPETGSSALQTVKVNRSAGHVIGVRGLSVRFGPVLALDNVELDVSPGTIHALAGQNGSGKSTLLKVMGGAQRPTSGTVLLDGAPISFPGPAYAAKVGVGLVYQELSLLPDLSGFANIFIGHEPGRFGFLNRRRIREAAQSLVTDLGFPSMDLSRPVSALTVAEQQVVEIVKCLSRSPQFILFDEPTASLTSREAVSLMAIMRRLRDQGYTVVFVSHRLDEVFEVSDRVTVLRDGKITWEGATSDLDQERLIEAMLGRALTQLYPRHTNRPSAEVQVHLEQAACPGLSPIDLDIHVGEVLGVAGAVGSGSSLFAEMLGGLRRLNRGRICVRGQEVRLRNPANALSAGIAYLPEDRRTDALFQRLSISTNMSLPLMFAAHSPLIYRGGFVRRSEERSAVASGIEQSGVRPADSGRAAGDLSGGNQQKVVLGRWFLRDVPCLVMNNPTAGIDVGSKADIYQHVADLVDSAHAVVIVSNYNEELLAVADRIIVFREGALIASFERGQVSEEELTKLTMSGSLGGNAPAVAVESEDH